MPYSTRFRSCLNLFQYTFSRLLKCALLHLFEVKSLQSYKKYPIFANFSYKKIALSHDFLFFSSVTEKILIVN